MRFHWCLTSPTMTCSLETNAYVHDKIRHLLILLNSSPSSDDLVVVLDYSTLKDREKKMEEGLASRLGEAVAVCPPEEVLAFRISFLGVPQLFTYAEWMERNRNTICQGGVR